MRIDILDPSGATCAVSIPDSAARVAEGLRFAPARYFWTDANTITIPVSDLVHTRARPAGIEHAAELMKRAYEGKQERRAPLLVCRRPDGKYLVLDGNSTAAVALAAGWVSVPAKLSPRAGTDYFVSEA